MRIVVSLFLILLSGLANGQSLFVAGPMPGHVDKYTARIWVEAQPEVREMQITYWPEDHKTQAKSFPYYGELAKRFNTAVFRLDNLEAGKKYVYELTASTGANGEVTSGTFRTQPADSFPDFSFLTGSCAANVLDTSIFTSMARTPADFMLWLGDNWYLPNKIDRREILWQGAHFVRSQPVMQSLLKAIPHYATWDDHDYGPNNSDKNFDLKEDSRAAFIDYWANPSYGDGSKGIYTMFSYGDVNFYLLDDRWWRSNDRDPAYLRRKPNRKKRMFGKEQLTWLKNELKNSSATFNIIVSGTQMLNANTKYDCFYHFPAEYNELMEFIGDEKIPGVIFFTGDRHHSEIIRLNRQNHYPLYDVTVSPFTSGTHKVDKEAGNPQRVPGTLIDEKQNYAKVMISGKANNRKLHVEFLGVKGGRLAVWEISAQELKCR